MSKNIIIQEGGLARQFTVDKLKTNLVGGGTCTWVPEDAVQLTTKTVNKDGTYKASSDGYYGFSQFTVKGVGTATGKDGDGDPAMTYTDPTTGALVTEKLPTSIEVTKLPNQTVWGSGATLDFTGIEVTAYKPDGTKWTDRNYPNGKIPLAELIFPTTTAGAEAEQTATSDADVGGIQTPFTYSTGIGQAASPRNAYTIITAPNVAIYQVDSHNVVFCMASATPGVIAHIHETKETGEETENDIPLTDTYTYNGQTVYYSNTTPGTTGYFSWGVALCQPSAMQGSSPNYGGIAWSMVYGTLTGGQEIPVQWNRPGDGEMLETSYVITVVGGGGHGED